MSIHYARAGHVENIDTGTPADSVAAAPVEAAPVDPLIAEVTELVAKARLKGATEAELHAGLSIAKEAVEEMIKAQAKDHS